MRKWVLIIIAIILLLAVIAFSAFIWLAMAGSLQRLVEDNMTMLRQDLILEDRSLSFEYESYGVEMNGLSPSVAISQPRIVYKQADVEYRITAPEVSVIGSFAQLHEVTLQAPPQVQLTVKQKNAPPHILQLELPSNLKLSLLTEGDGSESHMLEYYKMADAASGKIMVKDDKTGINMPVKYFLPRTERKELGAPYSQYLVPVLRKFSNIGR